MNVVPISQARNTLPTIIDQASTLAKRTYISVSGSVKAAIISAEELNSLEATMEILSDPKAMEAIKQGQKDIEKGNLIDWEDIKAKI